MMRSNRMALLIACLMFAASISAVVARPDPMATNTRPALVLENTIPKQFGEWQAEPERTVQVINPQARDFIDAIYSQVLERTYVNANGYRIMLSVAYGADQRGSLKAHEPEFCYAGQGFTLNGKETSPLATPFGTIAVRRLFTRKGARVEPVTYWIMVGDTAVQEWQSKLVELGYTVTGSIPDGLVFRVSSIDPDHTRAGELQDKFINELMVSVPAAERKRLSGLDAS